MEYHPKKKMTETLHHVLRAMIQFHSFFFSGDTPSLNKKQNKKKINSLHIHPGEIISGWLVDV
jgi:CTP:molybdopterin cytidylyltransferase MocA